MLAQADVFVKYGLVERAVNHLRRVFALDPATAARASGWPACWSQLGRRSEAAAELAMLAGQLAEEDAATRAGRGAGADARSVLRRGGGGCSGARWPRRPTPEAVAAALTTSCAASWSRSTSSATVAARRGARRCWTSSPSGSRAIR